jgi:hypothetical protein
LTGFSLVWFYSVFHVWLDLNSVKFFWFQAYQTKIEQVGFLKILIGLISFCYGLIFSVIFFSFFNLISFSIFFYLPLTPTRHELATHGLTQHDCNNMDPKLARRATPLNIKSCGLSRWYDNFSEHIEYCLLMRHLFSKFWQ